MSFDLAKPLDQWTAEELEAYAAHKRDQEKTRQIEAVRAEIEAVQERLRILEEKRRLHQAELAKLKDQLVQLEGKSPAPVRVKGARPRKRVGTEIKLAQIMASGAVPVPLPIRAQLRDQSYEALVMDDGAVLFQEERFDTLSAAAMRFSPWKSIDGWVVWQYEAKDGVWQPLHHLREVVYRQQKGDESVSQRSSDSALDPEQ